MKYSSIKVRVDGYPVKQIIRIQPAGSGGYHLYFEGDDVTPQILKNINWEHPTFTDLAEMERDFPINCGFELMNIEYHNGCHQYVTTIRVKQQYLGDITGLNAELKEKEEKITELENTVKSQAGDLTQKTNELEQKTNALKEKEDELLKKDEALAEKDAEISSLNDQLAEADEAIIAMFEASLVEQGDDASVEEA